MDSSYFHRLRRQARVKIDDIGRFKVNFSIPNIQYLNERPIFILSSQHFHTILSESWRNLNEEKISDVSKLFRSVYESKWLLKEGISYKSNLGYTFDEFLQLANSQFYYFRYLSNDKHYCFPLYSRINDESSVTGGFYHFLIRHFEKFSKIDLNSNDRTSFSPNDLLGVLIETSLCGKIVSKKEKKSGVEIFKEKECKYYDKESNSYKSKTFLVTLYYDNRFDYYSLNSFRRNG